MEDKSKSDFEKLILKNNKKILKKFKKNFNKEIKIFAESIHETYNLYKLIDEQSRNNKQKVYIAAYLFNAINNLISSFNLLISGYLIPAGNLMRHFTESCAIAISSSDKDFLERVKDENNKLLAQEAWNYINEHKKKLNINNNGWKGFSNLRKQYHSHSHASWLTIKSSFVLARYGEGIVSAGPNFDLGKLEIYRTEIHKRINAVEFLKNIIQGLLQNLTKT